MLNYLKHLFDDKKTYTIFMIAFCAIMLVVLFVIWWPNNTEKIATYNDIDLEKKLEENGTEYLNSLIFYVRYGQYNEIIDNLSVDYLNFTNKSKDEIKNNVFNKKVKVFNGLDISMYDNIVVYSTKLVYEDGSKRQMNIVETYPYDYTITFDNFVLSSESYFSKITNGLVIEVKSVNEFLEYKEYNLTITNQNSESVTINTENLNSVYVELEDGTKNYLMNSLVSNNTKNMIKNMSVNLNLKFDLPFSTEQKISKMVFEDVEINGKNVDIKFSL